MRPPVWFVAWSRSTLGVSLVGGRVVMRGSPHACVGWGCACPSSPRIPLQLEVWASWASHGPQWGRQEGCAYLHVTVNLGTRAPVTQSWPGQSLSSTSYGLPVPRGGR